MVRKGIYILQFAFLLDMRIKIKVLAEINYVSLSSFD